MYNCGLRLMKTFRLWNTFCIRKISKALLWNTLLEICELRIGKKNILCTFLRFCVRFFLRGYGVFRFCSFFGHVAMSSIMYFEYMTVIKLCFTKIEKIMHDKNSILKIIITFSIVLIHLWTTLTKQKYLSIFQNVCFGERL